MTKRMHKKSTRYEIVKNAKRIIAFGCSMVLVVVACCGCKKRDNTDISAGVDDVKISFSWWGNDVRHEYTMDGVDEFQRQNEDIDVDYRYGEWNGYETRMQVWMKSHTETDVMQINYAWLDVYSKDGNGYYDLYELSEYIDFSNFTEDDIKLGERNGKLNAVPIAFNTYTLYYNQSIYDSYGISLPKTWDDYFSAAKIMGDDGIYPLGMGKKQIFFFTIAYFEQYTGRKAFDEDGNMMLSEEDIKLILEFYKRLIDEKVVPPVDQFTSNSFSTGEIAGCMFWVSDAGKYCGGLKEAGGNPVLGEYPTMLNKKLSGWYMKPATMYSISATTEHPEAAARLLNFLVNSPDMAKLQGTEKGVPVSSTAVNTLENEGMIETYESEAHDKMIEERDNIDILPPIMEDSDIIDTFKKIADEYIYGVADLDTTANKMYEEFLLILHRE